jgi:hypothetical protein
MDNFNLDVTNYTNLELIELLSLPKDYNESILISAKKNLQNKLVKIDNPDFGKINEILLFLDNAHNRLVQELQNKNLTGTYNDEKNNVSFIGDHVIINNNNEIEGKNANTWNGKNVDTNVFPPGYLNPINIKTIKRAINIDTRFRPDYFLTKSTDFTLTLPERINKVVSMRLSSIEVPMSFYALSESLQNTTMKITRDSKEYIIKIPPGNYEDRWVDSTQAAYIEYAINFALKRVNLQEPGSAGIIKYTIDPVNGRSVFAYENPGGIGKPFKINFNVDNEGRIDNSIPLMFRLGWQLGFRSGEYQGETYPSGKPGNNAFISEGVCFINGPQYVYVSINDYNNSSNNFFRAAFSESILSPHILGRLNITSALQTNKVYKSGQDDNYNDSLNRTREYFGPVDIQRLTIQLLDEFGRVIDLNNMDWSFVLSFICLYD